MLIRNAIQYGAAPPPPLNPPVNISPPYMSGDTEQGGTVIFNPGTWEDADTFLYRVLRGDIDNAFEPVEVLLDWTEDTSALVEGIEDGDYLWLEEEATNADGSTVSRATAGHGPMTAAVPADATIIGTGGMNSATTASAQAYSFTMDIADVPMRKLTLQLVTQGANGAVNPTWNSVLCDGEPMTKVASTIFDDDASRSVFAEIWELNGTDVPVGTGILIEATKSASTNTMRSTMTGIAVGNTSVDPLTAGDISFLSTTASQATYSLASSTPVDKQLVLAFLSGNLTASDGSLALTPGTGWTTQVAPWPAARNGASFMWSAAMSKAFAVAGAFNVEYTATDTGLPRFGFAAVVRLAGDNS